MKILIFLVARLVEFLQCLLVKIMRVFSNYMLKFQPYFDENENWLIKQGSPYLASWLPSWANLATAGTSFSVMPELVEPPPRAFGTPIRSVE